MDKTTKKHIVQAVLITVSSIIIIWGLLTLLQTLGTNVGLGYIDQIQNIIGKYAIVIITMAIGIMTMSYVAGTFDGKVKTIFSISVCAFSTIMTIPLFVCFVLMIPVAAGAQLPAFLNDMVGAICEAFLALAGKGGQYVIYVLGIIMSIIFLAVPIISTYCTVKNIDLLAIIKSKLKTNKDKDLAVDTSEKVDDSSDENTK